MMSYDLHNASQKAKKGEYRLRRGFSYTGTILRNSLPKELRKANSPSLSTRGINEWFTVSDSVHVSPTRQICKPVYLIVALFAANSEIREIFKSTNKVLWSLLLLFIVMNRLFPELW